MSKFLDHFDSNVMEYPKSMWRKLWGLKPFYWLRCHLWTRYHIVDCRNDSYDITGYSWGWVDRDHLLLLANFNILADFIEKEHPSEIIDWKSDDNNVHVWAEMMDIYNWWRTGRKLEWEAATAILNEIPKNFYENMFETDEEKLNDGEVYYRLKPTPPEISEVYARYNEVEKKLVQKDEDNLIRLIKIRSYMWT